MHSVLLVDDNKDILDAMTLALEDAGFDVYATKSWDKVIDYSKEKKPTCIIMDVFLEGIDGRVLLESLKSDQTTKDIPVVMISAYPHIKSSTIESGADTFLAKPFTINHLISVVESVVED